MYSFPTSLSPSNPQGMFDDNSIGFGAGIQHEIFYSIKNGNWSDMTVWETVSGRVGRLPTANDDVYIRHTILININIFVNNFFISIPGTANFNGGTFTIYIYGVFNNSGTITAASSSILQLFSNNNNLGNFSGIASGIIYSGKIDQLIKPFTYNSLSINSGTKYMIGDLYCASFRIGAFLVSDNLCLKIISGDIYCSGVLYITTGCIYKTGGTINCTTLWFSGVNGLINGAQVDSMVFSGVNINLSGDILVWGGNVAAIWYISKDTTGVIKFTSTAIQSITNSGAWAWIGITQSVIIDSGVTVTNTQTAVGGQLYLFGVLNGIDGTSYFINKYPLHYQNSTQPMVTGVLDCASNTNSFYYDLGGNQDIKGGTYDTLILGGSGVKTLQGNVVVNTAYSVTGTATVNLNGYTLTHP